MVEFLAPLEALVAGGVLHRRQPPETEPADDLQGAVPHYVFTGPAGGGEPIRIGIFATIHGDEPESGLGLIRFLQALGANPGLATNYEIHAYPLCNPGGYADGTRHSRSGRDLNREFWRNSPEPEVRFLEVELRHRRFDGVVNLHCDDTSPGLYGFLSGHVTGDVLSAGLLAPALRAAERFLPRNRAPIIDGFAATDGILDRCYDGVLRAPPALRPAPFDITFETPQLAPVDLQREAFSAALLAILAAYRGFISHAADL